MGGEGYSSLQEKEVPSSPEESNSSKPCPEESANWISILTYWWTQPLLQLGNKRPLEEPDLYQLPPFLDAQSLADRLVIDWNKKRPLVRAFFVHFLSHFWFTPMLRIGAMLFTFINPFLLRTVIAAVKSGTTSITGHPIFSNAWVVVITLFITTAVQAVLTQRSYWTGLRCALTTRGAVMGAVYRKALRMGLSGKRLGHTTGSVTNMIAVDADSVMIFFWNSVNDLWLTPLQITILLILVCVVVGPSGLLGFVTMVAAIPLNIFFTRSATKFRSKGRDHSDQRVRLLNEILQGIRLLKLYHWEDPFLQRVHEIRDNQAREVLDGQRRGLWSVFVSALLPGTVLSVTFTAYVWSGHTLDAEVAFTALALFQNLKAPLGQLPSSVNFLSQFLVAANRLEGFLQVDEVNEKHPRIHDSENGDIIIENGEFWWDPPAQDEVELVKGDVNIATDVEVSFLRLSLSGKHTLVTPTSSAVIEMTDEVEELGETESMIDSSSVTNGTESNGHETSSDITVDGDNNSNGLMGNPAYSATPLTPTLQNINFRAKGGKLTCIVGPVGSGKSTLLHAILREIFPSSGSVHVPKDIAYTPQIPWLTTASLRDNVLFGRPMDETRYNNVLTACALVKDIELLPNGDLTEIGEQGINLSGGQKQRVSLARALYANPSCYILDEPLSAVDAHVATWLFESCIKGMMEGTTRVLVTHQLQFLPMADSIVVLSHGKISHTGTYSELVEQGIDFETLIRKKFQSEDKGEESEKNGASEKAKPEKASSDQETEDISEQVSGNQDKKEKKEEKTGIISAEERQLGEVNWRIYRDYFAASGHLTWLGGTFLIYIVSQVTFLVSEYWLVLWTSGWKHLGVYTYIYAFFIMVLGYAIVKRVGTVCVQAITHRSARNLHTQLLHMVLSARVSFFDMTPTGRIINRFSKDQDVLDNSLPYVVQDCFECGVIVICSITLICIITPLFILPLIGLLIMYYFIQKFYRKTSREIKRCESISRSPVSHLIIFSCFSETMNGITTIRAFKRQQDFIDTINKRINTNQKTIFYEFAVNRWLGVRLEWIASFVVLFSSCFAILSMSTLGPGLVGLLLATTLSFSGNLNWVVRQYTDLEVQMNAVERILHYCRTIPQEYTPPGYPAPGDTWPDQGGLEVRDLVIRYREDLDPVLRGISCSIKPGEKVGIVGRTGAGKSTLTTAIFRMVEPSSGTITIDGDPVLFSGTIRMNLDPFYKYPDAELWEALAQVHLKDHVASIPGQLDYIVQESGEGFSVGQRQLLCLGRVLLRKSKILVMDEATASLDFNTDVLIKATVRECFASKTLITIAHRLDTILDSDRVMVFDQGKIVEFDSPTTLLANPSSQFSLLVGSARASSKH